MEKSNPIRKTVLKNGVTIVTESYPSFHSASIGIWVKNGSRDESPGNNGISHFIEHMLFKGTSSRSALDIAKEMDALGGVINAFTTSENTCYYVKILKNHIREAADILSDIFLYSTFDGEELEKEREVIIQEIRMVEDTPDDHVHELFNKTFWGDYPLCLPVLGNDKNVSSFTRDEITEYMKDMYSAERIVITAAGRVNHEEVVDCFGDAFSRIGGTGVKTGEESPIFSSNLTLSRKRLEQVHICIGTRGVSGVSAKRYAGYLLNTVLGSGMSSRLFQEIREKRGLAYSIYSYLSTFLDAGMLGIYAGTSTGSLRDVVRLTGEEMGKLKISPLSDEDLRAAKEQLKGNIVLGLESSDSRMQRLAHNEIYFGRDLPLEESLDSIDAVTSHDIAELAEELFGRESLNMTILGNVRKSVADEIFGDIKELLDS